MSDDRGDEATDTDEESTAAADGEPTATAAAAADAEFVRAVVGERTPGVARVTIDRPDARNALNGRLRSELRSVFEAVPDDDGVRVVVLTGSEAAGAFVAGADVTELRERGPAEQRAASQPPRVYEAVADCPVPVIARVNGHALGGGCELAVACDVRVASTEALLGQPEVTLGLLPGGGGTQRLPRLVGPGQAKRLILSGDLVDAEEARDIGLVEAVHPPEELDAAVDDLAASIAGNGPVAVRRAKEAIDAAAESPLARGLEYERELFVGLFATRDMEEGIDAFLEDREPEWRGE